MRYLIATGVRAGLIAVAIAVPVSASAQSFLQSLFGGGPSPAQHDRMTGRPGVPAIAGPGRPMQPWSREVRRYSPSASEDRRGESGEDEPKQTSSNGKYRTLCVRTCDGYYFPIGNAVSRNRFMRDAAQCRASCGEEARLFYLPSGSDNVSTSLDLAGRSYVRMPTAFKYRKSLTDGCTCRPMPWSAAELQRHQGYAEEAARIAAEAEAKRLAAETAETERIASADKSKRKDKSKAVKPGDGATGDEAAVTETADGTDEARINETGAKAAHAATGKFADRTEPVRQAAPNRGAERSAAARRHNAVARAPAQQGGAISWFASSNAKYTWPGDPPRR